MLTPWAQRQLLKTLFEESKSGDVKEEHGLWIAPITSEGSPSSEIVLQKHFDWLKVYPEGFQYSLDHDRAPYLKLFPGAIRLQVEGSLFSVLEQDPYHQIVLRAFELENQLREGLEKVPQKKILIDPDILINVVDMFDQVNTAGAIREVFRGPALEVAVGALRKNLIDAGHPPLLTDKQAQ